MKKLIALLIFLIIALVAYNTRDNFWAKDQDERVQATDAMNYVFLSGKKGSPILPIKTAYTSKADMSIISSTYIEQTNLDLSKIETGDEVSIVSWDGRAIEGRVDLFESGNMMTGGRLEEFKRVAGQLKEGGAYSLTLDKDFKVTAGTIFGFTGKYFFTIKKDSDGKLVMDERPREAVVSE